MKLKETEKNIQDTICQYLALKKYFFWRSNNLPAFDKKTGRVWNMPKYSMNGIPDIIVIGEIGQFIGLEIKSKTGKQSEAQKLFQQKCEKQGAEYFLVRSLKEVQEIL